jgi:hypothetical protein
MKRIHNIFILLLIISFTHLTAQIRYVSKTGSATPPYTSWATASDSIQKCIEICNDGDTVIVGNGVYKESIIINAEITLIGSSMDSCIIDGTGLASQTVVFNTHSYLDGFNIIGKGIVDINFKGIVCGSKKNLSIMNCRISNAFDGIYFRRSSGIIQNVIITEVKRGIHTFCASDTCKPKLYNSVIIIHKEGEKAWYTFDGGQPTIVNNIMVTEGRYQIGYGAPFGIDYAYDMHKNLILMNNILAGFMENMIYTINDTATIINNIIAEKGRTFSEYWALNGVGHASKTRNNILINNEKAVRAFSVPDLKYNLFWNNQYNINSPYQIDSTDIIADPMFVKDTLGYTLKADYHLQKYSPAIDAGDPDILDIDGTRSDMGLFGGPYGQSYTYLDLAPKPPRNVTAQFVDGKILLKWNKNREADFFRYRVYRDTVPNFIYDTTKIIAEIPDTTYTDDLPNYYKAKTYYYKITAIDSAINQSAASEEVKVVVTGAAEGPPIVVEEYKLLQNYPNPFNPSTVIPYRLKEGGYVKIMVYNLLGEKIKVLVNGYQPAGYYEAEFKPTIEDRRRGEGIIEMPTFYGNDVVSGIYLYRIEVIGEGQIPRFTDMKKMMLIK